MIYSSKAKHFLESENDEYISFDSDIGIYNEKSENLEYQIVSKDNVPDGFKNTALKLVDCIESQGIKYRKINC